MLQKKIVIAWLTFAILALVSSCKNDLDVNGPKQDTMVVYAMIDASKPVQYIKLYRAFLDKNKDAYEIATNIDSIYYRNVQVKLWESNSANVNPTSSINFIEADAAVDGYVMDASGAFASSPNLCFKSINGNVQPNKYYKLEVTKPNGEKVTSSFVRAIGNSSVYVPNNTNRKVNFVSGVPPTNTLDQIPTLCSFSPDTTARLYDFTLRLFYTEINTETGTQTPKMFTWNILKNQEIDFTQTSQTVKLSSGLSFYRVLANNLQASPTIQRKIANFPLEYEVNMYGKDFVDYRNVALANTGINENQIFEPYTNISGGNGIFSSRNTQIIEQVGFGTSSLVELKVGNLTRSLNFIE